MKKIILVLLSMIMLISNVPMTALAEAEVPVITKITPADGATEVSPINLKMEVTFSTEMDKSTISPMSISASPDAILSVVPISGKKVEIYMKKLSLGTEYTIRFAKAIMSAQGAELVPTSYTFTTMATSPQYHMLTNGDFENENFFRIYADDSQNNLGNTQLMTDENGNKYAKIRMGWAEAFLLQRVYLESGKTYEVRARVMSDTTQQVKFALNYSPQANLNDWLHPFGVYTLTEGEWTEMQGKFTVPNEPITDINNIMLIGQYEGSHLSIDDWQFYEQGFDIEPPSMDTSGGAAEEKPMTRIEEAEEDSDKQFLTGLGIYGRNEYTAPEQEVTRESFAKYLAIIAGKKGIYMTERAIASFSDISEGYEGYAGVMADGDLLKADAHGRFNPYSSVKFEEACRAFVMALGYSYLLENNTPVVAASNVGLIKSAYSVPSKSLTYETLNKMLINAIEGNVPAMTGIKNGAPIYEAVPMLENNFKLREEIGIVNATSISSLDGSSKAKDGYIRIGAYEYLVKDADVSDLLGKKVKYYVDESGEEEWVVYICGIEKYNDVKLIDAENIHEFKDNYYYYYTDGTKIRKYRTADNKMLIYNNVALAKYPNNYLQPVYGSVELIDNNGDGNYDVVKVLDYQTYVVSSIDKENGIIYDKYENKSIRIDLFGELDIMNGKAKQKFDAIGANDVLSILQSADKGKTVIYRSTNVFTGSVGDIKIEDNKRTVRFYDDVHGSEIIRYLDCIPNYQGNVGLKSGYDCMFFLDAFGKIAAYNLTTSTWGFGYFIKANVDYESVAEETLIKLFTEDNKIETLTASDRLRINGVRVKNIDEITSILGIGGKLIKYRTDNKGQINRILTEDNGDPKDFRRLYAADKATYYGSYGGFDKKVFVDDNTKLFIVPDDANLTDESSYLYMLAKYYLISGKGEYNYIAYSANEKNRTAQIILLKDRTVKDPDAHNIGMISKIVTKYDEDYEYVHEISLVSSSGVQKVIFLQEEIDKAVTATGNPYHNLKAGDVVNFAVRQDGYPSKINVLYEGAAHRLLVAENPSSTDLNTSPRTFFGKLTSKEGEIICITDSNGVYELYNVGLYNKLYKYSREDDEVTEITIDELRDNASEILVVDSWATPGMMLVME